MRSRDSQPRRARSARKSGTLKDKPLCSMLPRNAGWHQTCSVKRGAKRVPRTRFVSCTQDAVLGWRARQRGSQQRKGGQVRSRLDVCRQPCCSASHRGPERVRSHSRGGASQSMLLPARAADDRPAATMPGSALTGRRAGGCRVSRDPRRDGPRAGAQRRERAVAVPKPDFVPSRSSPSRQRARHRSSIAFAGAGRGPVGARRGAPGAAARPAARDGRAPA